MKLRFSYSNYENKTQQDQMFPYRVIVKKGSIVLGTKSFRFQLLKLNLALWKKMISQKRMLKNMSIG